MLSFFNKKAFIHRTVGTNIHFLLISTIPNLSVSHGGYHPLHTAIDLQIVCMLFAILMQLDTILNSPQYILHLLTCTVALKYICFILNCISLQCNYEKRAATVYSDLWKSVLLYLNVLYSL